MKKITENIIIKPYMSKLLRMYLGGGETAVFDIETTGLNPSAGRVILSGILRAAGDRGKIVQYFAEKGREEKELLEAALGEISGASYLITYNGSRFDLPFIKKRAAHYGINADLPYTLDLYQLLKGYSPFRTFLPDLRQRTVESFMGLDAYRDDAITGQESADLYVCYLAEKSPAAEKTILLHNHDDLMQLYRLLPVIELTDFHRAMFSSGFPLKGFIITKVRVAGGNLVITAKQTKTPEDYISFPTGERPYYLSLNKNNRSAGLTVPCFEENGCLICDAASVLGRHAGELAKYPNVVNGYLIVKKGKELNHMEINAFAMAFFNSFLPEVL